MTRPCGSSPARTSLLRATISSTRSSSVWTVRKLPGLAPMTGVKASIVGLIRLSRSQPGHESPGIDCRSRGAAAHRGPLACGEAASGTPADLGKVGLIVPSTLAGPRNVR